jgi:hypothetical protein
VWRKTLKYLWLALFVLFVGIASYLAEELFFPPHLIFTPSSPEAIIHADFEALKKAKRIPPEIQSLKEIFFSDHRLKKTEINWEALSKLDFPKKKEGSYELQIEAFDAADETNKDNALSIFQFSLFDKTSKNKIWEISRTFQFQAKPNSERK